MSDDEFCPLCAALDNEEVLDFDVHRTLRSHMGFQIIKTKNMKGHAGRCMVVAQMHQPEVTQDEKDFAVAFLFRFITTQHRDHDWTILEPTHASIPNHWHMVASSLDEGEDMKLIEDTRRIEIRFKGRKWKDETDNVPPCTREHCPKAWCECDDCPMCRGNCLM